jgi:hypothetical protein
MRWWLNMVKETGISIKPLTCNKSLKLGEFKNKNKK